MSLDDLADVYMARPTVERRYEVLTLRNDPLTLTIPDDPEVIALVLCRRHLDCNDHIGGHDAYIWQAKRLLADLRSVEEVTRP